MQSSDRIILDPKQFELTIKRLSHQLIENHGDFKDTVIIGLQPRGYFLAERIHQELMKINAKLAKFTLFLKLFLENTTYTISKMIILKT